jgi:bis(5'-nucleosidyl)-tetraphosphatase
MLPTTFSCGAVVYRNTDKRPQVLLVKQAESDVSWGIPKGHMEPGETYVETAVRETKEEAGIDIKIITQLPHVFSNRRTYRKVVVPFLATQECDKEPSSTHVASEVADVRWFDVTNLPSIYVYQRPILNAALMLLGVKIS